MELYHVLNRGVEKRDLFLDKQDYARFVHNLYEFNDTERSVNSLRHFEMNDLGGHSFRSDATQRSGERIVDVHSWCLMKNHYHMVLSERVEGGISLFLQKVNAGYAKYFNEKYTRAGTLFQGRTKKILIQRDAHFLFILHYIHLNPLDYLDGAKNWRRQNILNTVQPLTYLDTYRWSSYLDYCGIQNFPSILTTTLFKEVFKNYRKDIARYLGHMKTNSPSDQIHITLE